MRSQRQEEDLNPPLSAFYWSQVYSLIGNLGPGRGDEPWKWAAETKPFGIANSWRTNVDIQVGAIL